MHHELGSQVLRDSVELPPLRAVGDEERGQLAAARWGVTLSLVAWSLGFFFVLLNDGAEVRVAGHADLAEDTEIALWVGSVGCFALAAFLWLDSSPRRVEARLQRILRSQALGRGRAESIT